MKLFAKRACLSHGSKSNFAPSAARLELCPERAGRAKFQPSHAKSRFALFSLVALFSVWTGSCLAGSFSTNAIADTFVATGPSGNLSGDNFGGAGALTVESPSLSLGQFQTVLKFDLSGVQNFFNTEYGPGAWSVQSVSLQLTASPHGNAIFNPTAAGQFVVSLMGNNTWVEGTGTGGNPTTDGISFNTLQSTYINNATDQALGTFPFVGGSSGTATYGLSVTSGVLADIQGESDLSLRLFAADNNISYLFNSRTAPPGVPELVIVATPEPATVQLGVTGLVMLSFWRYKKSRAGL